MNAHEGEEVRIFNAALALTSLPQRSAYLDQACQGDEPLRRRIEALLKVHAEANNFFSSSLTEASEFHAMNGLNGATGSGKTIARDETPGEWIGRYKLLEKLGEGG